jgi:hypothetical protein
MRHRAGHTVHDKRREPIDPNFRHGAEGVADKRVVEWGRRATEDLVGHSEEFRGAKGLGVHVGRIEFSVYLSGLDLSQCDLFLDTIEHHEEMFAFLCVAGIAVGHCYYRTVVFHDDGG